MSSDPSSRPTHPPPSSPSNIRPPVSQQQQQQRGGPASSSKPTTSANRDRPRPSLPFVFPPRFPPASDSSSTSLVQPSTAEGHPIPPLDDGATASPTSALRELSITYPSRPKYTKSAGAKSSTFSQPVIVRTYNGPPSRPASSTRRSYTGGGGIIGVGPPVYSAPSGPVSVVQRVLPFASSLLGGNTKPPAGGGGGMLSIARSRTKNRRDGPEPPQLPPVEAFSFKSFMANIESQQQQTHPETAGNGNNISADLDRIAEICARSRYSLSNQYEVHVAPHGSGNSFLASAHGRNQPGPTGPTLQAVSSDDERRMHRHRKRRSGGRRRSIAMGTLETIMSSSRSSDEDKSKKKSAAELTEEVRGRAARKESGDSSPTGSSSQSSLDEQVGREQGQGTTSEGSAKKKASFATAVIENTRRAHSPSAVDVVSPRNSATLLLSEPAQPQTSTSYLETRTLEAVGDGQRAPNGHGRPPPRIERPAPAADMPPADPQDNSGLLSSLGVWMPTWSFATLGSSERKNNPSSQAEGSLRQLLKNVDVKGKGVDRQA